MSEEEFDITTPRYFFARYKGFETLRIDDARNTRIAAFYAFLPHTKKGSLKRPEDLYHLPGDMETLEAIEKRLAKDREHLAKVLKVARTIDFFNGETMPRILPEA